MNDEDDEHVSETLINAVPTSEPHPEIVITYGYHREPAVRWMATVSYPTISPVSAEGATLKRALTAAWERALAHLKGKQR